MTGGLASDSIGWYIMCCQIRSQNEAHHSYDSFEPNMFSVVFQHHSCLV